jgi:hypothetical protein
LSLIELAQNRLVFIAITKRYASSIRSSTETNIES